MCSHACAYLCLTSICWPVLGCLLVSACLVSLCCWGTLALWHLDLSSTSQNLINSFFFWNGMSGFMTLVLLEVYLMSNMKKWPHKLPKERFTEKVLGSWGEGWNILGNWGSWGHTAASLWPSSQPLFWDQIETELQYNWWKHSREVKIDDRWRK